MKKFLSIAVALVLLFALAAPALAVETVVKSVSADTIEAETAAGDDLDATIPSSSEVDSGAVVTLEQAIQNSSKVQGAVSEKGYESLSVEIYDIHPAEGSLDGSQTIVIKHDNAKNCIGVFHKVGESWIDLSDTLETTDTEIRFTTNGMSPFALVFGVGSTAAAGETGTGTATEGTVQSPFTGDYTMIWVAAAAAMALGAAACFVGMRKRVTE